MEEKIKGIINNWFKIVILIIAVIFLFITGAYVNMEVKKHNYTLLRRALSDCGHHRNPEHWQNCVGDYMDAYVGSPPELKFPY